MDGVTGAIQERIRHYYFMGTYTMMFYINIISSIFLAASCLLTGELFRFFEFAADYPSVLLNMFWFALMSAVGQVCFLCVL